MRRIRTRPLVSGRQKKKTTIKPGHFVVGISAVALVGVIAYLGFTNIEEINNKIESFRAELDALNDRMEKTEDVIFDEEGNVIVASKEKVDAIKKDVEKIKDDIYDENGDIRFATKSEVNLISERVAELEAEDETKNKNFGCTGGTEGTVSTTTTTAPETNEGITTVENLENTVDDHEDRTSLEDAEEVATGTDETITSTESEKIAVTNLTYYLMSDGIKNMTISNKAGQYFSIKLQDSDVVYHLFRVTDTGKFYATNSLRNILGELPTPLTQENVQAIFDEIALGTSYGLNVDETSPYTPENTGVPAINHKVGDQKSDNQKSNSGFIVVVTGIRNVTIDNKPGQVITISDESNNTYHIFRADEGGTFYITNESLTKLEYGLPKGYTVEMVKEIFDKNQPDAIIGYETATPENNVNPNLNSNSGVVSPPSTTTPEATSTPSSKEVLSLVQTESVQDVPGQTVVVQNGNDVYILFRDDRGNVYVTDSSHGILTPGVPEGYTEEEVKKIFVDYQPDAIGISASNNANVLSKKSTLKDSIVSVMSSSASMLKRSTNNMAGKVTDKLNKINSQLIQSISMGAERM